jgi:integrase
MSRRSGQNPKPAIHRGWWTIRYWIDVRGQEKRIRVRAKICPISGPGSHTSSEIERKAREIIQASGADTVEHFEKCAASTLKETFRQRADAWLKDQQTKEDPIAAATASTYKSALNKWLKPNFGDLPLGSIYADTVRDGLSPKFRAANLPPKTRHAIVAVVQLVIPSVKDKHGEPVHKRTRNHDFMGIPKVKEQRRPRLTAEQVAKVVNGSTGRYRALAVLLAGGGLRIGEALAIRLGPYSENHTTASADFKTIHVRKSVRGTTVQKPKTESAVRSVNLCNSMAAILKEFAGTRTDGFLFQSDTGRPLLQSNLLRDWLHKHHVEGFHTFRRFRTAHLRKCRVPWDLEKFWIGHANKDITDRYAEQLQEDVEYRQEWASKIGLGFNLEASGAIPMGGKEAA